VQIYSLNPATLGQTILIKALDVADGRITNTSPNNVPELTRWGGDLAALDNGNFVAVPEDRSLIHNLTGRAVVATIVGPDGSIVKDTFRIGNGASDEIWSNVAAYRGGFAVRIGKTGIIYFFDNSGNLQGTVNVTNIVIPFGVGDRGDSGRIASDIRSSYLYFAEKAPDPTGSGGAGPGAVYLGIWDTRTRNFVTSAAISETDTNVHEVSRTTLAVDALDRVCVIYGLRPNTNTFANEQIAGRVMAFDGTNITFLTPTFLPFMNHDSDGAETQLGFKTFNASIAMTPRQICIAAKGRVNSTNNPAAGPDTAPLTDLYTVISHPAPVAAPRPQTTVTKSGSNVIISWPADAGLFTLQSTPTLAPTAWANVNPQPPIVSSGSQYTMTAAIGPANKYFRLAR